MNIFDKNNDKETVSLYKKECKRLEQERNDLLDELNAIKQYKKQYQDLIAEVTRLKNRYEAFISQTVSISNEYKEKLENVIKTDYYNTFFNDFNWKWFSIGNTFENRVNKITVTGNCDIHLSWRAPRKAVI